MVSEIIETIWPPLDVLDADDRVRVTESTAVGLLHVQLVGVSSG